MRKTKQEKERS
jgi:hypothetical protein